jgi:hypothetical protein
VAWLGKVAVSWTMAAAPFEMSQAVEPSVYLQPTHTCVLHLQFANLKPTLEFEIGFQQGLFEV